MACLNHHVITRLVLSASTWCLSRLVWIEDPESNINSGPNQIWSALTCKVVVFAGLHVAFVTPAFTKSASNRGKAAKLCCNHIWDPLKRDYYSTNSTVFWAPSDFRISAFSATFYEAGWKKDEGWPTEAKGHHAPTDGLWLIAVSKQMPFSGFNL